MDVLTHSPVGGLDVVRLRGSGYVTVEGALGVDDAVDGGWGRGVHSHMTSRVRSDSREGHKAIKAIET